MSHASRTMASLTLLTGFVVAHTAFASPLISERDRDNYCRHYANMAVKDQAANEKFGCGYKGPAWHSNFGAHYGWCMRLTDVAGTNTPDAQQGVERHSAELSDTFDAGDSKLKALVFAKLAASRILGWV